MKKYFYSLSLSLSLSLVFFLSSLNVYAQNKTTTADKFLEEMYNKELYDSAKIYGQNGIDAIYLITSRCADGDSNADEVAKKYCEAYKDYAFLDSNMVKHNFYNENDGYHDAKTSMIAEVNGAALFAPKTAAVVKTTNNEWIVVERNSNEVKAFFPAQIRTRKNVSDKVGGETVIYTIYYIHFVTYDEFKKAPQSYSNYSMGASGLL